MMDDSRTPVIAGLAAGIAFILVFATLGYYANNEDKSMISAAETSPIAKAFLAKYPDAVIKIETGYPSGPLYKTGVPAISFSKQTTSTVLLLIHLDNITHHPDKILLGCYGEQLGTQTLLDYKWGTGWARQIEKSMTEFIETYHCLRAHQ